mgnify:CR=1 FL=1
MTKVVNIYKNKYDIYIGRPNYFGNPFVIGIDGTRKTVIKLYKEWFYKEIKINSIFKTKILELKGKILGCYCSPKECHGDIITEYLNNL